LPVAISLGGLDSSNGAGVTLDASIGRLLGVHFHTIPAVIVAETPDGVENVKPIPLDIFRSMLELHLHQASAVKTALLGTRKHLETLAATLRELAPRVPLVADPVHQAGAGGSLLTEEAEGYLEAWKQLLLPRARLVAVNAFEAEELTGIVVTDEESMLRAAKRLVEMGAWAAVVKGGHVDTGEIVIDVYFDKLGRKSRIEKPRLQPCGNRGIHGLGCIFTATATAMLAQNKDTLEAFHAASRAAWEAAAYAYRLPGSERCVADPARSSRLARDLLGALENIRRALRLVWENWQLLEPLVPETGMNIAEAPGDAREPGEVAAVEGRVTRGLGRPVHGCPAPGASSHMARLILALRRHGVPVSAAVNAKPLPQLLRAAKELGMKVLPIDRSREPNPEIEGSTMEWVASLISANGGVDMVYDLGAPGKEPMLRVLGHDALEALEKLLEAARRAKLSSNQ